jgi:hypothetical protein
MYVLHNALPHGVQTALGVGPLLSGVLMLPYALGGVLACALRGRNWDVGPCTVRGTHK